MAFIFLSQRTCKYLTMNHLSWDFLIVIAAGLEEPFFCQRLNNQGPQRIFTQGLIRTLTPPFPRKCPLESSTSLGQRHGVWGGCPVKAMTMVGAGEAGPEGELLEAVTMVKSVQAFLP